jgi:menaquinone-specific isochorismate synthase
VGGTPVMVARRFIADHEPDRGWYAAPLGFVDARGDAEVFVGLRCVLLRGTRAYLWAGAGIVAASEAAPEWDETVLKMRPMLRALGVEDA